MHAKTHPQPTNLVTISPWTITTPDGVGLGATVYEPARPEDTVLLLGGIGIRQRLYRHFAQWLAEQGIRVITADYRSVGESTVAADVRVDLTTWGKVDIPAIFEAVCERYGTPILVGHSFGGQALGLAAVMRQARRILLVTSGSADRRLFDRQMRAGMFAWFGLAYPVLTRLFGTLPSWAYIGGGLRSSLVREWSHWIGTRGWLMGASAEASELFASVDAPVRAYSFTDDRVAPPLAVRALLDALTSADVDHIELDPADIGARSVGHAGFFRPGVGDAKWDDALAFIRGGDAMLEEHPQDIVELGASRATAMGS